MKPSTLFFTIGSPSPVVSSLVVKKGKKVYLFYQVLQYGKLLFCVYFNQLSLFFRVTLERRLVGETIKDMLGWAIIAISCDYSPLPAFFTTIPEELLS